MDACDTTEVLGSIPHRTANVLFFFFRAVNVNSFPLTLTDFCNNGSEISEKFSENNYLNFSCI